MKTVLTELIEDVKRMEQGLDVEELSAYVYKRATELLEKEREQIEMARKNGRESMLSSNSKIAFKTDEQYYKETFKQ